MNVLYIVKQFLASLNRVHLLALRHEHAASGEMVLYFCSNKYIIMEDEVSFSSNDQMESEWKPNVENPRFAIDGMWLCFTCSIQNHTVKWF